MRECARCEGQESHFYLPTRSCGKMRSAVPIIPILPELLSVVTAHLNQQWDRELTEQLMTKEQYTYHWREACTQFIGLSQTELDRRYGWMKCVDYGWLFRFLSTVETQVYRVKAPVCPTMCKAIEANVQRTLEWHAGLATRYGVDRYTCCHYYQPQTVSVYSSAPTSGTVMLCDTSRPHKYDCHEQKRIIAVLADMHACASLDAFREMVGLASTYLLCHDNVSTISGMWANESVQCCCCHSILEQVLTSTAHCNSFEGMLRDILSEQVRFRISAMMNLMED